MNSDGIPDGLIDRLNRIADAVPVMAGLNNPKPRSERKPKPSGMECKLCGRPLRDHTLWTHYNQTVRGF